MMIRTLKDHTNGYPFPDGKVKPTKTQGDEYEMPDDEAKVLIDDKIAEKVTKAEQKAAASDTGDAGASGSGAADKK